MDEGSRIIEDLLRSWTRRREGDDGEDVIMDEVDSEESLDMLKECLSEYKARIDGNPWTVSLLSSL